MMLPQKQERFIVTEYSLTKRQMKQLHLTANASQLIVAGFQEAAGVVDTYANNSWMSGFPGMIDQVRLYGVALAPADVAALYANKQ